MPTVSLGEIFLEQQLLLNFCLENGYLLYLYQTVWGGCLHVKFVLGSTDDSAASTKAILDKLDKNKDGKVSKQEFVSVCESDKELHRLLVENKAVSMFSNRGPVNSSL